MELFGMLNRLKGWEEILEFISAGRIITSWPAASTGARFILTT
jgi:hypothetical protein